MSEDIPLCSKCRVKTEHDDQKDEYVCPICAAIYNPNTEIVEYEDSFTSSHEDEMPELGGIGGTGPGLVAADDDRDPSLIDQLYTTGKHIPRRGENTERWDN